MTSELATALSWSAEQLEVAAWLALPKPDRRPPTQEALARKLKVHVSTIWRWRSAPAFQVLVTELTWARVRDTDVIAIIDAQVAKAKKGDTSAADWVVFKLLGYTDHTRDADPQAPIGPMAGAQASASVLNVYLDGEHVEEENARRAGARALMGQFRVLPSGEGAASGASAAGVGGEPH